MGIPVTTSTTAKFEVCIPLDDTRKLLHDRQREKSTSTQPATGT